MAVDSTLLGSGAPEQCAYEKPHPSHSWWQDKDKRGLDPLTYRRCEGVKDPNAPTWGEGGRLTHSKQALGEYELWCRGNDGASAGGERHLHFLYDSRGKWEWVVRWSGSVLCNTPRCQRVEIRALERTDTALKCCHEPHRVFIDDKLRQINHDGTVEEAE